MVLGECLLKPVEYLFKKGMDWPENQNRIIRSAMYYAPENSEQ